MIAELENVVAHRRHARRHHDCRYHVLKLGGKIGKHGKGGYHNHDHGKQRHQGQECGKREAGGYLRDVHLIKAVIQKTGKRQRARAAQGFGQGEFGQ